MNEIIKGLYLGGYDDAIDSELLHSKNITHILTVHELKLSKNFRKDFQYMYIESKSIGEIDLLSKFATANEFIKNGIKFGGVLVHCQFGMSRSSTIAIAYIMFKDKRPFEESFEMVKLKRPVICPSDSFVYQLRLFEHMQYNLDVSYQIYRLYRNYFTVTKRLPHSELVRASVDKTVDNYKCYKCQTDLFHDDNFNFHLSEETDLDFQLSCYFDAEVDEQKYCSKNKICIEIMDWMEFPNDVKGLLKCPNCSVDIGNFCLPGQICECGKWIFTAIFIDHDKVVK